MEVGNKCQPNELHMWKYIWPYCQNCLVTKTSEYVFLYFWRKEWRGRGNREGENMSPKDNREARVGGKWSLEFSGFCWFELFFCFFKSQYCLIISSFHNQKLLEVSLCLNT